MLNEMRTLKIRNYFSPMHLICRRILLVVFIACGFAACVSKEKNYRTLSVTPILERYRISTNPVDKLEAAIALSVLENQKELLPPGEIENSKNSTELKEAKNLVAQTVDAVRVFEGTLHQEDLEKVIGTKESVFFDQKRFSTIGFPDQLCDQSKLQRELNQIEALARPAIIDAISKYAWLYEMSRWEDYLKRMLELTANKSRFGEIGARAALLYQYWLLPSTMQVLQISTQVWGRMPKTYSPEAQASVANMSPPVFEKFEESILRKLPECFFRKKNGVLPMSALTISH